MGPAAGIIASGALGGIAGAFPDTGESRSSGGNRGTRTGRTTPTFDPEFSPLKNLLIKLAMGKLQGGASTDVSGITNNRISGINQLFKNLGIAQKSRLAAGGAYNAGNQNPVAVSADLGLEQARGGEIAKALAEEPLLARQFEQQDLGFAMDILGMGRGSESSESSDSLAWELLKTKKGGGFGGFMKGLAGGIGYGLGAK